jgi:hypothetical protein
MPQIQLKTLNRLNVDGKLYYKGVPIEVDVQTALNMLENERFKVTGLNSRDLQMHQFGSVVENRRPDGDMLDDPRATVSTDHVRKPVGEEFKKAILDAAADMDEDEPEDMLGRPSVHALTAKLGYSISTEERNAAFKAPVSKDLDGKTQPPLTADAVAANLAARVTKGNVRIHGQAAAAGEKGVPV